MILIEHPDTKHALCFCCAEPASVFITFRSNLNNQGNRIVLCSNCVDQLNLQLSRTKLSDFLKVNQNF